MTLPNDMADQAEDVLVRGPSAAGGPHAIALLLAMARWGKPCRNNELVTLTGISAPDVSVAMKGLKDRGRVVCDAHGRGGRWHLPLWPGAPKKDAADVAAPQAVTS